MFIIDLGPQRKPYHGLTMNLHKQSHNTSAYVDYFEHLSQEGSLCIHTIMDTNS